MHHYFYLPEEQAFTLPTFYLLLTAMAMITIHHTSSQDLYFFSHDVNIGITETKTLCGKGL